MYVHDTTNKHIEATIISHYSQQNYLTKITTEWPKN